MKKLITIAAVVFASSALATPMMAPLPPKKPADVSVTKPAAKTWPPGYKGLHWLPPLEIQNKVKK